MCMRLTILQDRLDRNEIKGLLTFPNESPILALREHPALLIYRLAKLTATAGILSILAPLLAYFFLADLIISLQITLLTIGLAGSLAIREIVHWYFHIYLITNRKIAEIRYSPLSSEFTNSILLDQLRCTEIDAELRGFMHEMFDIGNVTITFDRPTHQETFTLRNVRSPRKTANALSSKLHTSYGNPAGPIWTRQEGTKYTFLQENNARTLPN